MTSTEFEKEKLTLSEAKRLLIHGQILNRISGSANDVLLALGYVQIDTISVVERAHHHIFWSRFPKYQKDTLMS